MGAPARWSRNGGRPRKRRLSSCMAPRDTRRPPSRPSPPESATHPQPVPSSRRGIAHDHAMGQIQHGGTARTPKGAERQISPWRAHPVRPGTRTTHGSPVLLGAKAQVKHTSASCEHPSYLYVRTYVLRTWSCARSPRYNDGDGPNGGIRGTEATTHLGSPLDWIARPWPRRFLRRWGASSSSRQKRTGAVGRGPQGGRIPAPSPQSPLCTPARSPALGRQTQCRERVQETPLTPWP